MSVASACMTLNMLNDRLDSFLQDLAIQSSTKPSTPGFASITGGPLTAMDLALVRSRRILHLCTLFEQPDRLV